MYGNIETTTAPYGEKEKKILSIVNLAQDEASLARELTAISDNVSVTAYDNLINTVYKPRIDLLSNKYQMPFWSAAGRNPIDQAQINQQYARYRAICDSLDAFDKVFELLSEEDKSTLRTKAILPDNFKISELYEDNRKQTEIYHIDITRPEGVYMQLARIVGRSYMRTGAEPVAEPDDTVVDDVATHHPWGDVIAQAAGGQSGRTARTAESMYDDIFGDSMRQENQNHSPVAPTENAKISSAMQDVQTYANRYATYVSKIPKGKGINSISERKKREDREARDIRKAFGGLRIASLAGPDLQDCIGIEVPFDGKSWMMVMPSPEMIRAGKATEGVFNIEEMKDFAKDGMLKKFCLVNPDDGEMLFCDIQDGSKRSAPKRVRRAVNTDAGLPTMRFNLLPQEAKHQSVLSSALSASSEKLGNAKDTIGTFISNNRKAIAVTLGGLAIATGGVKAVQTIQHHGEQAAASVAAERSSLKLGEVKTFTSLKEAIDDGYIIEKNGGYMAAEGFDFVGDGSAFDPSIPSAFAVKRIN